MGKLKFVVCFLFFCIVFKISYAATGCFLTNDNVIYTRDTGDDGTYYINIFIDIPVSGPHPIYDSPLSTVAPACPRAMLGASTGVRCIINKYNRGLILNYTQLNPPVQCPLDNYIWFLILPLGGLGFYYMCKRNLQSSS